MALARTSFVWGGSSSISRDFKIRSSVTGNAVKDFSSRKQGLERDLVPLNDRLRSLSVLQLLVYRSKTLRRRRLRCSGTSRRYRFGKSWRCLTGQIRFSDCDPGRRSRTSLPWASFRSPFRGKNRCCWACVWGKLVGGFGARSETSLDGCKRLTSVVIESLPTLAASPRWPTLLVPKAIAPNRVAQHRYHVPIQTQDLLPCSASALILRYSDPPKNGNRGESTHSILKPHTNHA